MAGRGEEEEVVEMMPKGILAREKWEEAGMSNQDVEATILSVFVRVLKATVGSEDGVGGGKIFSRQR